ncbi:Uncharacterised protein [Enterobacter cloacae]|nr:Uncharacterised protein [Enterobacter cloacae]
MVHRMQPAPGDFISQRVVAVLLEPLDRHPLQRRPAVGFIPLLAGFILGRQNAARGQQSRLDRIRQALGLLVGRHTHIQRHNAGGRKQRQLFASPVVIAVTAALLVPQVAVHRRAAIVGLLAERLCRFFIPFRRRNVGDRAFQLEQEGVQVNRDKLGCTDAGEPRRIAQPAGRVIPA